MFPSQKPQTAMPLVIAILVALTTWSCTGPAVPQQAVFHVSPDGSDASSGAGDAPFRTITRARDAVRQLKRDSGLPAEGVVIEIAPGTYTLDESFTLTTEDSGDPGAPVIYRASEGGVHVIGGKSVEGFQPVSDPGVRDRLDPEARQSVTFSVDQLTVVAPSNGTARGLADGLTRGNIGWPTSTRTTWLIFSPRWKQSSW
jgi:hypothetical protein